MAAPDDPKASAAQHYLNPLHVYCRLRDLGVPGAIARGISSGYERAVYRPVTGQAGGQR